MLSFDIKVLDSSYATVYSANASLGSLGASLSGVGTTGSNEFKLTFNTFFNLGAGNYYLHVGAVYANPAGDVFFWSSHNTSGDGFSLFNYSNSGWQQLSNRIPDPELGVKHDQAFTISSAVPEPFTTALMALGAAAYTRRRLRARGTTS